MLTKLAYFPPSYPDEDFRSIIYRYHVRVGYYTFQTTNKELFNKRVDNNPFFPRNLNYFLSRVELNYVSENEIIKNNTYLPYLLPFVDKSKQLSILDGIRYEHNHELTGLGGNRVRRNISAEKKYCVECLIKDFEEYGECYLHRTHQIVLKRCYKHYANLISTCPVCKKSLNNDYSQLWQPKCRCGHEFLKQQNNLALGDSKLISEVYEDMVYLCNMYESEDRKSIISRYKMWLAKNGYINKFLGTIIQSKLQHEFIVYARKYLDIIDVSEDYLHSRAVYIHIFKDNGFRQSLAVNILMMRFLAGSIKNFFEESYSFYLEIPFGHGPWECINSICPDYGNLTAKLENRKAQSDQIIGHFKCEVCGFIYTFSEKKKYKYPIDRGWLWKQTLLDMIQEGVSVTDICKELNTTEEAIRNSQNNIGDIDINMLVNKWKGKMLEYIQDHPTYSRQQLSDIDPTTYINIKRADRKWFEETLPPMRKKGTKINWELRDIDFLDDVKLAIKLAYEKNPRKQIKAKSILNELPSGQMNIILINKDKLPKCWQEIDKNLEQLDNYLIRTLPMMISRIQKNGSRVTYENLIKYKKEYGSCSEDSKRIIELKLSEYNGQ